MKKILPFVLTAITAASTTPAQWGPDIDPSRIIQGSGSGLDADLLDGKHGSEYAVKDEDETITGSWEFVSPVAINADVDIGGASDVTITLSPLNVVPLTIYADQNDMYMEFQLYNTWDFRRVFRFYDSTDPSPNVYYFGWSQDGYFTIGDQDSGVYHRVITAADGIASLADVEITTPDNGDVLVYDSAEAKWVNAPASGGSSTLDNLTDVSISSPNNGEVLVYNNGVWQNAASPGGASAITDLTDVDVSSPNNGDVLVYNNGTWQNQPNTDMSGVAYVGVANEFTQDNTFTRIEIANEGSIEAPANGTIIWDIGETGEITIGDLSYNSTSLLYRQLSSGTLGILDNDAGEWVLNVGASGNLRIFRGIDANSGGEFIGTLATPFDRVYSNRSYINGVASNDGLWWRTTPTTSTQAAKYAVRSGTPQTEFITRLRMPTGTSNGVPAIAFGDSNVGIHGSTTDITFTSSINVAGTILPTTSNTFNLGSNSFRWENSTINTMSGRTLTLDGSSVSDPILRVRQNTSTSNTWHRVARVGVDTTSGAEIVVDSYNGQSGVNTQGNRIQSYKFNSLSTVAPLVLNPHGGFVGVGNTNTPAYTLDAGSAGDIRAGRYRIAGTSDGLYVANGQTTLTVQQAYIGSIRLVNTEIIDLESISPPAGVVDVYGELRGEKLSMLYPDNFAGSTHLVWWDSSTGELTVENKNTPVVFINNAPVGKILMNWESTNTTTGRLHLGKLPACSYKIEIWNLEDYRVMLDAVDIKYEKHSNNVVAMSSLSIDDAFLNDVLGGNTPDRYLELYKDSSYEFEFVVPSHLDNANFWIEITGFYQQYETPSQSSPESMQKYIDLRNKILLQKASAINE
jgi:hypothetical protein